MSMRDRIINVQPMTRPIGQAPHKQFDLYAKDAHKQVGGYIDVSAVRRLNAVVSDRLHKQKKLIKAQQRENCERKAKDPQAVLRSTNAMAEQLNSMKIRARRLSGFLHWLKVGNQAPLRGGLTTEELQRLIDEFFTDVITRLGRVAE